MLSKPASDNTTVDTSMPPPPAISAADLAAPIMDVVDIERQIGSLLASPEFRDSNDWTNTSPAGLSVMDDFDSSPLDTPYADFLTTPLFADDHAFPGDYSDKPLFPPYEYKPAEVIPAPVVKPAYDLENLYEMTPLDVPLDSFDTSDILAGIPLIAPPAPASATPAVVSPLDVADKKTTRATTRASTTTTTSTPAPRPTVPRRRTGVTGLRKGVTPESLLDEDAPTQPRKYVTPSSTSRKEIPAVFARKRARSAAFPDEEDQLDELPPNPTELDLIEQKRRQNTVAARRSRKRKLEYYQSLERALAQERALKEAWTERTNMLLGVLHHHGISFPPFPADPPTEMPSMD